MHSWNTVQQLKRMIEMVRDVVKPRVVRREGCTVKMGPVWPDGDDYGVVVANLLPVTENFQGD
jgi:hypothetical protein